jgi:predicted Zn-dependent protease
VRHPKGTGSGWAGHASFDLHRVDLTKIASAAFDKCLKSIDPVRLEPGRYQTILEPQAVEPFVDVLIGAMRRRESERGGSGPFMLGYDQAVNRIRTKLGLQILDRRLSLFHNPGDPISGTHREDGVNEVCWVKDGILTSMWEDYDYALDELDSPNPPRFRTSFVMSGTETATIDEMISTMKRGLLVTRVSGFEELDHGSMLYTGCTRDGLWLVENGKITKAVRNFRFTESPLFILNNVETVGATVPTFIRYPNYGGFAISTFQNAVDAHVVPALKVNDFSFTSTIDAI